MSLFSGPLVEFSLKDFVSVDRVVFTENCPDGQNATNCLGACLSTSFARRCFSREELQFINLSGSPFMKIDVRKAC